MRARRPGHMLTTSSSTSLHRQRAAHRFRPEKEARLLAKRERCLAGAAEGEAAVLTRPDGRDKAWGLRKDLASSDRCQPLWSSIDREVEVSSVGLDGILEPRDRERQ
jgi:hypothetical protein